MRSSRSSHNQAAPIVIDIDLLVDEEDDSSTSHVDNRDESRENCLPQSNNKPVEHVREEREGRQPSRISQRSPIVIDLPSHCENDSDRATETDKRKHHNKKTEASLPLHAAGPANEPPSTNVKEGKSQQKQYCGHHHNHQQQKTETVEGIRERKQRQEIQEEILLGKYRKSAENANINDGAPPLSTIMVPATDSATGTNTKEMASETSKRRDQVNIVSGAPTPIPPPAKDANDPLASLTPSMWYIEETTMSGFRQQEERKAAASNTISRDIPNNDTRQSQHFLQADYGSPYTIEADLQQEGSFLSFMSLSFRWSKPNTRRHARDNCRNLCICIVVLAIVVVAIVAGVCWGGKCKDDNI